MRDTREQERTRRIEWLQVQLAAQRRQLDNADPSPERIATIRAQMECYRDEVAELRGHARPELTP